MALMLVYEIGGKIGSGGFGEVLRAQRKTDGLPCAMKRLTAPTDAVSRARFAREVRLQSKLRHAHVMPIIEARLEVDEPWFTMPLAVESLEERLQDQHGEDLLWTFRQIAEAVAYAHENGVLHRDIKPGNVLILASDDGQEKAALSDFGLGVLVTRDTVTLTSTRDAWGTAGYISPEQVADTRTVDHRTDVYSLGKLLYRILSGLDPVHGLEYSRVPPRFHYVIRTATHHEKEQRFQSVVDLLNHLDMVEKPAPARGPTSRPADDLRSVVQRIAGVPAITADDAQEAMDIILSNLMDREVMDEILPRLPEPLVARLAAGDAELFLPAVRMFDNELAETQPFEYCDVVADFYERIYGATGSNELRELILARLLELGPRHNRWHVGRVAARLIRGTDDPSLILTIRDLLAADQKAMKWHEDWLRERSLPKPLKELLDGLGEAAAKES